MRGQLLSALLAALAVLGATLSTNLPKERGGENLEPPAQLGAGKAAALPLPAAGSHSGREARGRLTGWERTAGGPGGVRHPVWQPEWYHLKSTQAWFCSAVLLFAGALCAAGGIGGGGVYVTVLMAAGGLEISDAVPLSKSIVFVGSIASLILNIQKSFAPDEKNHALIDYNVCRLVIPASLGGTFLGVLLNGILPDWFIALVLTSILLAITGMVTRTTIQQYKDETGAGNVPAAAGCGFTTPSNSPRKADAARMRADSRASESGMESPALGSRSRAGSQASDLGVPLPAPEGSPSRKLSHQRQRTAPGEPGATAAEERRDSVPRIAERRRWTWHAGPRGGSTAAELNTLMRAKVTLVDALLAVVVLSTVVIFGSLRHHAQDCQHAAEEEQFEKCHHPTLMWLGKDTLQNWMQDVTSAALLSVIVCALPLAVCVAAGSFHCWTMVTHQGWQFSEPLAYQAVGVCTGVLAGLVGIGGGLIYSPFLLFMQLEPAVAVATSSTCVIFTAASTSMQYLLTDRVILSLTFLYGIINLVASYAGTRLVHLLQDSFATRRSYISAIVAAGVLLSTVLALWELAKRLAGGGGSPEH